MSTLTVKRFCGLTNVVLEIKPLTILIGPQASGKSLLAKLAYYFHQSLAGMVADASSCVDASEFKDELANKFRLYFPPVSWGQKTFEITYVNGDFSFKITRLSKSAELKFELSDNILVVFELILAEIAKIRTKSRLRFLLEEEPEMLAHYLSRTSVMRKKIPGVVASGNALFVPAGRSFFANLDSAVWPILRKQKVIDPFLIEYGVHYQASKNFYSFHSRHKGVYQPKKPTRTEKKLWDIIGGELSFKKDEEFVESKDGRSIPIANLSSGQQELLPLLLGVFRDLPWMEARKPHTVFIEEPEAHLFPSAQKEVVEFIVAGFNAFEGTGAVFITTHSPYVLATINNLLLASRALGGSDIVRKRVARIIPQDAWLSPDCLAAFAISEGVAKNILDDEVSLIDATFIDSVSSEIATSFDKVWRAVR